MDNNIEWICPYCESKTYTTIDIWTGKFRYPGENRARCPVVINMYVCDGCSCMFGDPDKFNLVTDLDYDKQSIGTRKRSAIL